MDGFPLIHDLLQILPADSDQRGGHALTRAVAPILHRILLKELQFTARHDLLEDLLRRHAAVEHGRNRAGLLYSLFQPVDDVIRCAGQKLKDITACGAHLLILADQNTQRAGRRDLLALRKIGRHVLRDLAGNQLDTADVRLLHLQIADDGEHPVRADRSAHIELAGVFFQQRDPGILHVAANISLRVGCREDGPQRPAALDLERQRTIFDLLHISH